MTTLPPRHLSLSTPHYAPVDMGLVFFSLVNAGVTIGPSGIGSNALLIFLSLFLGKAFGVVSFYKVSRIRVWG